MIGDIHYPDAYRAFALTYNNVTTYHIFAGWIGGYLHGSAWRRSTPIVSYRETPDMYFFTTESGTEYHCSKHTGRFDMYCQSVYEQVFVTGHAKEVEVMELLNYLDNKENKT